MLSYSLAPLAQALLVKLFKESEEMRHGKMVALRNHLHMARCEQVPDNILAAASCLL